MLSALFQDKGGKKQSLLHIIFHHILHSSVQTTELEGPLFWSSSHHSHPEIVSETLNQTKSETSLNH